MKIKVLLCCFLLLGLSGVSNALTIIDGSTSGYYNSALGTSLDGTNPIGSTNLFPLANVSSGDPLINPAPEPDLSSVNSVLGDWLNDPGNLNSNWTGLQSIPSTWAVNSETAIVYAFDAGAGLENLQASFGVDNGLFVWLDGTYISGALAPGGAYAYEYTYALFDLSAGTHYLQVLREDHGGSTGWAINVTGDQVAPVPEPGTMLLLGVGLAGLVGMRKKFKC